MKYALIALAALTLALYAAILLLPLKPDGALPLVALALTLAVVQFGLLRLARPFSLFGRDLTLLFYLGALALLIRVLVLVGSDDSPALSPEAYRYVWEGKMIVDGYNPYTVTPYDIGGPDLANGPLHAGVCAPHLPATHPPLAQYLFAAAYLLHHDSIHGYRLLSFIFELLTLLAIVVLMIPEFQKWPFQSWSILIYAFSPAIILPFLLSSHLDILAAPFFIFSLVFLRRGIAAPAGIMLALAALVKTFPLIFAPVMLFHFVGRDKLRFMLGFGVVYILFYLPYFPGAGFDTVTASFTSLLSLPINGVVYSLLTSLLHDPGYALLVCGLLLLITVAIAAVPLRKQVPQVSRRIFFVATVALLLSPTLYPEHLIWLLPFVVLRRNIAVLAFSAAILLTYYPVLATGAGATPAYPWWLVLLIYLPILALAAHWIFTTLVRQTPVNAKEKGPVIIDRPL